VGKSWPVASKKDLQKFCEVEGWTCVSHGTDRRPGKGRDHHYYELALDNGNVLRTKISHPIGKRHTYGTDMWRRILREQLCVTQEEFWACVNGGKPPRRS
jgi:hypothetical protein